MEQFSAAYIELHDHNENLVRINLIYIEALRPAGDSGGRCRITTVSGEEYVVTESADEVWNKMVKAGELINGVTDDTP